MTHLLISLPLRPKYLLPIRTQPAVEFLKLITTVEIP